MANATSMVTVGCRLPNGVVLELFEENSRPAQALGPGQSARATPQGGPVASAKFELAGQNKDRFFVDTKGYQPGMVGITHVPADFWTAWKKQHASSALLATNLVFEAKDEASVEARAKELRDEQTGFEQTDPSKQEGIETSDRK